MNNETILHAFMEQVWNKKDLNAIADFVHISYHIHLDNADPWEGKTLNHTEFVTRLHYSFDAFPDMQFDIQQTISDGNCVAVTWIMTGTNKGHMGNIPPTNKAIRTNGTTIYYFKDGKISGHSQVFDRSAVIKQLGF